MAISFQPAAPAFGPGATLSDRDAVAPPDLAYTLTPRMVAVAWDYAEPEPGGACTGFDVAIYQRDQGWAGLAALAAAGSAPDGEETIAGGALAMPLMHVADPAARSHAALLELAMERELTAAVRARYGQFCSRWAIAGAPAVFLPDAVQRGEDGGAIRLPDGTVMRWHTTPPLGEQAEYVHEWAPPFAGACFCVTITPRLPDPAPGANVTANDNFFQLVAMGRELVRFYKQSTMGSANATPCRAHIVAWGR
jgi:hypothetical protein